MYNFRHETNHATIDSGTGTGAAANGTATWLGAKSTLTSKEVVATRHSD
jgi:hypothetical protein